jgi:hypothetical protein
MSSDDDLRLNTLHRFSKQSPRMTLQEYSHCEVPAGCGGVVLRWVAAGAGTPIRVGVAVLGEAEVWLDGTLLPGGHTRLVTGQHVLAIHVTKLGRLVWEDGRPWTHRPIPCAIHVDTDPGPRRANQAVSLLERVRVDARRITYETPSADFFEPAFDDRGWSELEIASGLDPFALSQSLAWRYQHLHERGVTLAALGTPGDDRDEAWIRLRFTASETMLADLGGAP